MEDDTIGGLSGGSTRAEESSLSSWAGPYVTDMLGRGAALATQMPYTAYQGPLTAGPSALQSTAYSGLSGLTIPSNQQMSYTPTSFTGAAYAAPTAEQLAAGQPGTYTPASGNVLQQYMTPYLQGALDPQYAAARRQAEISQQALQGQYAKAGAYGGSRQGVAEAELQRGLLDRMAQITGTGYQQAYEQAQNQFNTEEARRQAAAGQAQQYGLQALQAQQQAGAQQRAIEQEGVMADIAQFEQERDYPYKQVQFMQSLLQGLPLETQSYSYYEPSGLQSLAGGLGSVKTITDLIRELTSGTAGTTGGSTARQTRVNQLVAQGIPAADALNIALGEGL